MIAVCPKMAALKDVVPVYKNLKEEWAATPCNLKKCGELLNQLKVIYIKYIKLFESIFNIFNV